jgi:two-component system OmpR family response regulator
VGKERILVVDDDRKMLDIIARMLKDAGYEVHCTEESEKAVALAGEVKPDLAILDLMMPGLDGFGLVEKLRATPELAKTPCMFLTAKDVSPNLNRANALGAVAYVEKPFSKEQVLTLIRGLLSQKK